RWLDESQTMGRRIAHPYARGVDRSLRVWLARERGDHDQVLRLFDPKRPVRLGPVQWVTAIIARSLFARGRIEEARAHYADLVGAGVAAIPRNIRWHDTIGELALLCAELGDAPVARELVALLEPVSHHHAVLPPPLYYAGPFTRALARLHE